MTENTQEESAGPGSKALWMGCQDELTQVVEQSGSMYELTMNVSNYFAQRHLARARPEPAQLSLVVGVFVGVETVVLRYIDIESGMVFSLEENPADRAHENVTATMKQMTYEREMQLSFVLGKMYRFPGFAALNGEAFAGFGDPSWLRLSDEQLAAHQELIEVVEKIEETFEIATDFVTNEDERMAQMLAMTERPEAQKVSAVKLMAQHDAAEAKKAECEAKKQS